MMDQQRYIGQGGAPSRVVEHLKRIADEAFPIRLRGWRMSHSLKDNNYDTHRAGAQHCRGLSTYRSWADPNISRQLRIF